MPTFAHKLQRTKTDQTLPRVVQRLSGAPDLGLQSAASPRLEHNLSQIPNAPGPSSHRPFDHDFSSVRVLAEPEKVREAAEYGTSANGGPLPYTAQIQRSFGRHNIRDVVAYWGERAAAAALAIGARAYTAGGRVAFAGAPDLHTAAHEATHAVQQRAGVNLRSYMGEAGDSYERHADAVADQVVRGHSAEALLDRMAPAGAEAPGSRRQVLQRAPIITNYGKFDTTKYEDVGNVGSETGVFINLTFDPDPAKVNATKIGLTQAVRTHLGGVAVAIEPSHRGRMVPSGPGEGYEIDRATSKPFSNPIYASEVPGPKDKLGDTPLNPKGGQWGWHYTDGSGNVQHQMAKLNDRAHQPGRGNNSGQTFETAALAIEGKQNGTYMGSVTWGWKVDGASKFSKLPLTPKSKGNPSAIFKAAAQQWNKSATAGVIKTNASPTRVYDSKFAVKFTVDKDTVVELFPGSVIHGNIVYNDVTIKSGPHVNKVGAILGSDLSDTGGGTPNIKLPIP